MGFTGRLRISSEAKTLYSLLWLQINKKTAGLRQFT